VEQINQKFSHLDQQLKTLQQQLAELEAKPSNNRARTEKSA
jgi:prefoldin subunit 5